MQQQLKKSENNRTAASGMRAGRISRSLELSTGVTLPILEQGDPRGLPVLFLHGATDSCHSFEPVLDHLPASIHAVAVTHRGHGDASRPDTGYRYGDFAADVAALMDALGIEAAVIAGHSMSSAVAQRFAVDYPERTLGLVLLGAFSDLTTHAGVSELGNFVLSSLADPVDPDFVRDFQASTLAQPVPEEYFEMVVSESLKVPARVWKAAFEGFAEEKLIDKIDRIGAPTLVFWGDRDTFCLREDQDILLAKIKNARLLVYEGAGHAMHWEEPERFAADLVRFVEGL